MGKGRGPLPPPGFRTLRIGLSLPARPSPEVESDVVQAPSEEEVSRAIDTLMRLSAAREDAQWERAVDGLHDSLTLDAARLYQARQHAAS